MHVLFVCTANRDRSPTAEALFRGRPGLTVASAGTAADAARPVEETVLRAADLIVVMEAAHHAELHRRFGAALDGRRVAVLGIPDVYRRGDPALIALLERMVPPLLEGRDR